MMSDELIDLIVTRGMAEGIQFKAYNLSAVYQTKGQEEISKEIHNAYRLLMYATEHLCEAIDKAREAEKKEGT